MGAVLLLSRGKSKAHVLILPEPLPSCCGELTSSLFTFFISSILQAGQKLVQSCLWGSVGWSQKEGTGDVSACFPGGAKLKLGRRWRAGKSLGSDPWDFNSLLKLV